MARQWRIEYENAIYHILSRGNQRQSIFRNDKDRNVFLDILEEASERFSLEIYAYVLMGNHYHLLLKTCKSNLSKTMQWIGTVYTQRYNHRHKKNGHLFQGRFKSIVVENETYLLRLSYYIHLNPLRARLVDRLADYRWSSYNAYAYAQKRKPDWLETGPILSKFSSKDKHRSYRISLQENADEPGKIWEDVKHGLLFGSEAFIEHIRSEFLSDKSNPELPQLNRLKQEINPAEFIAQASAILGSGDLKCKISKYSCPELRANRNAVLFYVWKNTDLNNHRIGDIFGLTNSAVSRIVANFRKELLQNKSLQEKIKILDSRFKV